MVTMQSSFFDLTFWVVAGTALHIATFVGVCLHALKRRKGGKGVRKGVRKGVSPGI